MKMEDFSRLPDIVATVKVKLQNCFPVDLQRKLADEEDQTTARSSLFSNRSPDSSRKLDKTAVHVGKLQSGRVSKIKEVR